MSLNTLQSLQVLNCLAPTENNVLAFDFLYLSQRENAIKRGMVLCENVVKRKFRFSKMYDE